MYASCISVVAVRHKSCTKWRYLILGRRAVPVGKSWFKVNFWVFSETLSSPEFVEGILTAMGLDGSRTLRTGVDLLSEVTQTHGRQQLSPVLSSSAKLFIRPCWLSYWNFLFKKSLVWGRFSNFLIKFWVLQYAIFVCFSKSNLFAFLLNLLL